MPSLAACVQAALAQLEGLADAHVTAYSLPGKKPSLCRGSITTNCRAKRDVDGFRKVGSVCGWGGLVCGWDWDWVEDLMAGMPVERKGRSGFGGGFTGRRGAGGQNV